MTSGKIEIQKILKNSQGYEECEESSHSSYPPNFSLVWSFFKIFLDFILLGYSLNRFITLRRRSNDFQKNPNSKILKNSIHFEGVKWIEKFKKEVYRKNMWGVWISILLVIIPFLYFQYFNQFFWKAKK